MLLLMALSLDSAHAEQRVRLDELEGTLSSQAPAASAAKPGDPEPKPKPERDEEPRRPRFIEAAALIVLSAAADRLSGRPHHHNHHNRPGCGGYSLPTKTAKIFVRGKKYQVWRMPDGSERYERIYH